MTRLPSHESIQAIALRATESTTPEALLSVLEDLLSTCLEVVAAMLAERSAASNPISGSELPNATTN